MQPLKPLLDRIRWDADFGRGAFSLGYHDRVLRREVVVPLASVDTVAGSADAFTFADADGVAHTIPFHRVRAVYRDGVEIWRRPEPLRRPRLGVDSGESR